MNVTALVPVPAKNLVGVPGPTESQGFQDAPPSPVESPGRADLCYEDRFQQILKIGAKYLEEAYGEGLTEILALHEQQRREVNALVLICAVGLCFGYVPVTQEAFRYAKTQHQELAKLTEAKLDVIYYGVVEPFLTEAEELLGFSFRPELRTAMREMAKLAGDLKIYVTTQAPEQPITFGGALKQMLRCVNDDSAALLSEALVMDSIYRRASLEVVKASESERAEYWQSLLVTSDADPQIVRDAGRTLAEIESLILQGELKGDQQVIDMIAQVSRNVWDAMGRLEDLNIKRGWFNISQDTYNDIESTGGFVGARAKLGQTLEDKKSSLSQPNSEVFAALVGSVQNDLAPGSPIADGVNEALKRVYYELAEGVIKVENIAVRYQEVMQKPVSEPSSEASATA